MHSSLSCLCIEIFGLFLIFCLFILDPLMFISFILGDAKSLYVGNLPPSVSVLDLEREFMNFGKVKHNGIAVRNRKVSSVTPWFGMLITL